MSEPVQPAVPMPAAAGRSYDAAAVAAAARQKDPSLPEDTAAELAAQAWAHLRDIGTLDAPECARRLLAAHPQAGATPANVVASAAVQYCEARHIEPGSGG